MCLNIAGECTANLHTTLCDTVTRKHSSSSESCRPLSRLMSCCNLSTRWACEPAVQCMSCEYMQRASRFLWLFQLNSSMQSLGLGRRCPAWLAQWQSGTGSPVRKSCMSVKLRNWLSVMAIVHFQGNPSSSNLFEGNSITTTTTTILLPIMLCLQLTTPQDEIAAPDTAPYLIHSGYASTSLFHGVAESMGQMHIWCIMVLNYCERFEQRAFGVLAEGCQTETTRTTAAIA